VVTGRVRDRISATITEAVLGHLGITVRTFRDPEGSESGRADRGRPRHGCLEAVMQSEAGADAMKFDGVRPETLLILAEG
jgi:hypothetical protein